MNGRRNALPLFRSTPILTRAGDALVADVHTDVPSPGDPGCVLHQGVGNVDLLLIAIDNGKDRMVYAGPVLSHYEFEMGGTARKTDSEWKADLRAGARPEELREAEQQVAAARAAHEGARANFANARRLYSDRLPAGRQLDASRAELRQATAAALKKVDPEAAKKAGVP